jgi:phospholipase C
MMENRAFDHMVGFLGQINPEILGLTGNESNPYNVSDPSYGFAKVAFNSSYVNADPGTLFYNNNFYNQC